MKVMERRALITWSSEYVRRGLPEFEQTIDPAWFGDASTRKGEGWSLACRFESTPKQQGNPSSAHVHFRMDSAPHHSLTPGAVLRMFERGTGHYARVEIVGT